MDRCLPFVLIFVTEPGRCGPLMVEGNTLVCLGCPAEGTGAGGNPGLRGSLRGGHVTLRRREPVPGCGWGLVIPVPGFQLVNPRADRDNPLPDLLAAALPLVLHPYRLPGLGRL
jgi:hypothetical protein